MTAITQILLVDDSPEDIDIAIETLAEMDVAAAVSVAHDGVEALSYLRRQGKFSKATRPSLILLDLNMPKKDGREVLEEIKQDPDLKDIPVVILTTSSDRIDIRNAYLLHANCYVTKPLDIREFRSAVQAIKNFWFATVQLPSNQELSI